MAPVDMLLDQAEWEILPPQNVESDGLPVATHRGILRIGSFELECFQLSNGKRVFTEESLAKFFGGPLR